MRLFGKVDNTVDRYDRAEWITPPFDSTFRVRVVRPTAIGRPGVTQSQVSRVAAGSKTIDRPPQS